MKLFPHNKEAYDNAVRMFKRENKVCIIQPTGTGKSVVIAEFINQNPSKRHLLLAPGSHIFNEIQKHVKKPGILCSTYIGLKSDESFFVKNYFDYIYLDEFHRLGADVWGGAVKRLLRMNPRAKVFGTSATPIRYLDDNRNMATEIFNNRIATQMSLISAIDNGILPAPIYVSALYSVQDDYQRMKSKLLSSNLKNKETLLRDLDSKVIDWEKSSGLDTVITKHLGKERRRVIVFCKDWDHMQNAQKLLSPIFQRIYGRVQSLLLYSKKKTHENETSLRKFMAENESSIVLYTIDKVNEGLHSKNCNTVILLRDTISANVFYQQIGRAFSIESTNRPLIIDLVNNFKNIQYAPIKSDSENELNLLGKRSQESGNEKRKETIAFIDETKDIRQIFFSFENAVDVWERFYEKAKAYFTEHGNPYVDSSDKEFEKWVRDQTTRYRAGEMGKEREKRLRAIGMDLDIQARWMVVLIELREWVKNKGGLPTNRENKKLYSWMIGQREAFKDGKLLNRQVSLLRNLISLESQWRMTQRVDNVIKHFTTVKDLPTDKAIKYDLTQIKVAHQRNRLSEITLNKLRKANVPIDESVFHTLWLRKVRNVLACYKKNGRLPKQKEEAGLYYFCNRERRYLKRRDSHPHANFIEVDREARILFESLQKILGAKSSK